MARHGGRLATAALAALACSCTPSAETVTACSAGDALPSALLVLETDYAASGVARVEANRCVTERGSLVLGADPALARSRGRAFVVVRDQSRVVEVDPETGLVQDGHGWDVAPPGHESDRTNPQDIALDDAGDAWVPRYDVASLAILGADGVTEAEIDLASLADADGNPEASAIAMRANIAFVALERLARPSYAPTGPGRVAVLDGATRSLVGSFDLVGRDPFGRFVADPTDDAVAYLATPGDFRAIDASDGVDRIDLEGRRATQAISEATLGGSVSEVAIASATEGWALVAGPSAENPTSLVRFDPSTGVASPAVAATVGYQLSGLAIAGDLVVVGDRDRESPRLRLFERASGVERAALPLGLLPPLELIAVR